MIIAKNQKGIKKLNIEQNILDKILSDDIKFIVGFGSNGKGKSTIKDLFVNENLKPNFEYENEEQTNEIKKYFEKNKKLIFDSKYIADFIYANDSLKQNETKIILKTDNINEIYNNKFKIDENINNILNISKKYLNEIIEFKNKFYYKGANGNATKAKKRYATTFIKGSLPHKYDELFKIDNDFHKRWWYEGLYIYNQKDLDYCPWCKNGYDNFSEEIKEQLNHVKEANKIDSKLFSDKTLKISEFTMIKDNTNINDSVKVSIEKLIEDINNSIDNNLESVILSNVDSIIEMLENDEQIFKDIIDNIRVLDNITEFANINITNNINNLKFYKINDELDILSNNIDSFLEYVNNIEKSIQESNIKLHNIISNSQEELNNIIKNLGLKYKIEIDDDNIVSNGINEDDNYIMLKSYTGKDVSDEIGVTLSYGEKNTLAFAFFIEQIKNTSDEDTIVIFDDPISSYDLFRRYTSLGLLRNLKDKCKKIILLSHESNFVSAIVSCYKKNDDIKCLIINETKDGELELCDLILDYSSEMDLYKNMLNFSNDFTISQRVLALRKLYELYRYITMQKKLKVYDYLCKLIHYRKKDSIEWKESYINDIKQILLFYGITYDSKIEQIKDESRVFDDIDNLYNSIVTKNVFDLSTEEIVCLRMISEKVVRDDSKNSKNYKEKDWMKLTDSTVLEKLEIYTELLNAITHSDDEECLWPELNLNDLKAIPKFIISQIINIIK